jgi:cystathionine beta-lyase family protein involved in aluminum resistance
VIKAQDPSVLVLVDNCYGEFTEEMEPTAVGAGGATWIGYIGSTAKAYTDTLGGPHVGCV